MRWDKTGCVGEGRRSVSSWLRGTQVACECLPDAHSSKAQSDDAHRGGEQA